jgi:hypothetical protein
MPSFRSFHEGVVERAKVDTEFRRSLLRECTDLLLNREFEVAHRLAKDYILSADYIERMSEDLDLDGGAEAVINLFDPEVNGEGNRLFLALIIMLQNEGLSLTTRRQISFDRRRLS